MSTPISRKNFITTGCKGLCALAAGSAVMSFFESCSAFAVYKTSASDGKVSIPVSEFAVEKIKILRISGLEYDILMIKKTEKEYIALVMKCTHQDWLLTANPKGLTCSSHGSMFDLDGNVTNGPATEPLKKYKTTVEGDRIYVS